MRILIIISCFAFTFTSCKVQKSLNQIEQIEQWTTYEIDLVSNQGLPASVNRYIDLEVWAEFYNEKGDTLTRPAFWYGGNTWKVRFSPPDVNSIWSWKSHSNYQSDIGLSNQTGSFTSAPNKGNNKFDKHGTLMMSPGKRSVIHADGHPFLVVGDTPWALPFRATVAQAKVYAKDRQRKGFNTALLMSIQPDMEAVGPNARDTSEGFARGFSDLSQGHINNIEPSYFNYLDSLIAVLLDHEIVPVFQPVFHGFGWKGQKVLGNQIIPEEYVRYCKYLLARYGNRPAMWLLAGDNGGRDPGVKESGEMMEIWDCYRQPTGLHYNPCDDYIASWAVDNPIKHCEHLNKSYQTEKWLDFQWAQSGHDGEHLQHKVDRMYNNLPTKAVANGEPTYEGMAGGKNGLGWWQGEEAWSNLVNGGTMGVVYGAAGLWQWMITSDEPGWPEWTDQKKSWHEAMQMEGALYVGLLGKILSDYDLTDIESRKDLRRQKPPIDKKPLLAKIGELYISFNVFSMVTIRGVPVDLPFTFYDAKTGDIIKTGKTVSTGVFISGVIGPTILVVGEKMENANTKL